MTEEHEITQYRMTMTVANCFVKDGWFFVQFENSWESLGLGPVGDAKQVPFGIGETVDIIIRRRNV